LDTTIDNWLIPLGENHYRPVAALAALGSPPVTIVAIIACLTAIWRTRRYWPAGVLTVMGPVLAVVVAESVLKPLLGRTHYGDLSLPSGHATAVTSVVMAFLVAFVAAGLPGRVWLRRLMVLFALLAVAGTALAVVALDRHYATDAVAGVLTGACVSGLVALVLDAGMRALAFHPAEDALPEPIDDGAA
jgi:membrane-associated phospholipid phosphatase